MTKRFTIGTDPEFFLRRKEDGKLMSAIPHIKGTKDEPQPLPQGGNVQYDNFAVEFATDPAVNGDDLVVKIGNAFKDILITIPEDHELVVKPSAEFDDDQLEDERAHEFGCDPDYDAWGPSMNNAPSHENKNFRSCGGHIHVGKADGDGNDFLLDPWGKINTIKMMDVFHGFVSAVLDDSAEAISRRELYGKAGCHRPVVKDTGGHYDGVEYRVLSNFWLKSPELVMLMDSLTQDVLSVIRENKHDAVITAIGGAEKIQQIINEGMVEEAREMLEKHVKPLMSKDSMHYLDRCVENIKTYDFKKEWQLEV